MTSGVVAHSRLGMPTFQAWRHATWRKRLIYSSICLGGVVAFVIGLAGSAFANAANPTFTSAKVYDCSNLAGSGVSSCPNTGGSDPVLVKVSGTWSWGELAGTQSSPQTDCAGRYGVGWSVDWWGIGGNVTSIPGLQGSVVNPATNSSGPSPSASGKNPDPVPGVQFQSLSVDGTWQAKNTSVFHTSALYNGFVNNLCQADIDKTGAPSGPFEAFAAYPDIKDVPAKLCVNFYDPHGSASKPSTSQNDNFATKDDDNSIKTNSFDPANVSGNCAVAVPAGSPKLSVGKTGPATGNAGGTGTYRVTLSNTGTATATGPTSFVDKLPVGETFDSVDATRSSSGMSCQPDSTGSQIVDCTYADNLDQGTSAHVAITVKYGDNTGGQTLTDCAGLTTSDANACVPTHIPQPDLSIAKSGPATGVAGGQGVYPITVTNNGDADATSVSFVDVLPVGETFVSDDQNACSATTTQRITCNIPGTITAHGGSATITVTVSYGANTGGSTLTDCAELSPTLKSCVPTIIPSPSLDLAIVKKVSATRVVAPGTLTYTLTVTNVSNEDTTGLVTVTDTVPAGETITSVDGGSDWTCSFAGASLTCTYNGQHLAALQTAGPIKVVTDVAAGAPDLLVNTGVVDTPGDTNPANNQSTVRTRVTHVLGVKIVKTPTPTKPAVLPFTGWSSKTALTLGLALLVAGLRLMNFAARRRRRTT
ncbi:MAG TPA: hypothetical protein VFH54_05615 [Mycobacteriales bacterium]|nr:hypothetical protein [Mycobacteriales bacterium]